MGAPTRRRWRPPPPAAAGPRFPGSRATTEFLCPDRRQAPGRLASLTDTRLSELFALASLEPVRWYGSNPAWRAVLEARACREYGPRLTAHTTAGRLTYRIDLDVPGRVHPVPVTINFYATPPYSCYNLPPADYPRVHAEPGAASPHRMPSDDALCLWHPRDPPLQRWTADKGLLDLLDLTTTHLLYEAHWRATDGTWAGDEAPHGFAVEET